MGSFLSSQATTPAAPEQKAMKTSVAINDVVGQITDGIDLIAKDILENKLVITEDDDGQEFVCQDNSEKKLSKKVVYYYKNELQKLEVSKLSKTAYNLGLVIDNDQDGPRDSDKAFFIKLIVDFYTLKYSFLLELRDMQETCVRPRNAIADTFYQNKQRLRLTVQEEEYIMRKIQNLNRHTDTYIERHRKLLERLKRDISLEELKELIRQGKILIDEKAEDCQRSISELFPLAYEFDAKESKYLNILTNEKVDGWKDFDVASILAQQPQKNQSFGQEFSRDARDASYSIQRIANRERNLFMTKNRQKDQEHLQKVILKDKEKCDDKSIKRQYNPTKKRTISETDDSSKKKQKL